MHEKFCKLLLLLLIFLQLSELSGLPVEHIYRTKV